jgi:ribose 5-phosphate isomerase B
MRIAIGSDHAGFQEKGRLTELLRSMGHEVLDFGTDSDASADYPDYAAPVAEAVSAGRAEQGVLICGTGVGMSIAANKVRRVRAAACQTVSAARLSREHNNANVLCVGARLSTPEQIREIIEAWFAATFEGGRHARRVEKIHALEAGSTGDPR